MHNIHIERERVTLCIIYIYKEREREREGESDTHLVESSHAPALQELNNQKAQEKYPWSIQFTSHRRRRPGPCNGI